MIPIHTSTSSITTTSSTPAAAPMSSQWALRTRLTEELRQIATCIRQWDQNDETTKLIDRWRSHFMQALHTHQDERETLRTHIDLMQRLLHDPISREPFTDNAVLGSDGHTYAQETIDVYSLPDALPAEWRGRSPLDIEDPRPFTTTPHLVIPHMIGWLRSHNALLLPTAQQPPQPPATAEVQQARIQRIIARTESAQNWRTQSGIFQQQMNERFSAFQIELDQMLNPLGEQTQRLTREGTQQLDALASRDAQQTGLLRTQIAQMAEHDHQALASSAEQLGQTAARQHAALDATRQNLASSIQEDRDALHHVAQRVQEAATDQRLAPLAEGIAAYTQVAAELQPLAHRIEAHTRRVQHSIRQLDQEIDQLDAEDQELQHNLNDISARLGDVQRQEIQLRRDMIQIERAIQEQEKGHKGGFMKTALIIGGACLFVCWGMTALAEGGLSAGVTLKAGGAAAIGAGIGISASGGSKKRSEQPERPPQHRPQHRPTPSPTDRSRPAPSEPPPSRPAGQGLQLPPREAPYARLGGRLGPPPSWLQDRGTVHPYEPARNWSSLQENRERLRPHLLSDNQTLQFSHARSSYHGSPEDHTSLLDRGALPIYDASRSRSNLQEIGESVRPHLLATNQTLQFPRERGPALTSGARSSHHGSPANDSVSGTHIGWEIGQALISSQIHHRFGPLPSTLVGAALSATPSHRESPEEESVSGTNIIREIVQATVARRIHLRVGHRQASLAEGALGASHSHPESDPNPVRSWFISAGGHAATAEIASFVLPHAVPSYWAAAGAHVAAEVAGPLERRVQRFLNTASPEDYALPPQLSAEALDFYQAAQVARGVLHAAQMPSHALHALHDQIVQPLTRAADAIGLTDQTFQRFYEIRESL
jgi:hypothetical protein